MRKILFYLLIVNCFLFSAKSQITIDGDLSDWNSIPILSEPGVFPFAKVMNDGTNLNYALRLADTNTFDTNAWNIIDLYLDADNNNTSGMKGWLYVSSGVDYLVQGTDLYKYTGTPGADNWLWGGAGTATRACSTDAHWVEERVSIADLTTPTPGTVYNIGFPHYYSSDVNIPVHFPGNDWDFTQRKGFVVKTRTEIELTTTADFTSANAYYFPFMKDENIAQYLDFQSGAWSANNPKHWASWALNLVSPGEYEFQMTSSGTGSGKVQLSLVDMSTNAVVKTFSEVWYPADATMTDNSYNSIDMSDVPAGKYMLKLTNPTAWDTFLKVGKLNLKRVSTLIPNVDSDETIKITVKENMLNVHLKNQATVKVFSLDGRLLVNSINVISIHEKMNSGFYIVSIESEGKQYSQKVIIK